MFYRYLYSFFFLISLNATSYAGNYVYQNYFKTCSLKHIQDTINLKPAFVNYKWTKCDNRKSKYNYFVLKLFGNKYYQEYNFKGRSFAGLRFNITTPINHYKIRAIVTDFYGNSLLKQEIVNDYAFVKDGYNEIEFIFDEIVETTDQNILVGFEVLEYHDSIDDVSNIPIMILLSENHNKNYNVNTIIEEYSNKSSKIKSNHLINLIEFEPFFHYYTHKSNL